MAWSIKYSDTYETAVEAYKLFKDDPTYQVPKAIAERPELDFFDVFYLEAFYALGASRQTGMAEGYIPLESIIFYAEYLQESDVEAFVQIITACDREYLRLRYEKSEKESKSKGNK